MLICRSLGNCTVWINKKKKCFLALTECPLVESSGRDVVMTADPGGRRLTRRTQAIPADGMPSHGKFQNPTPCSAKPQWKPIWRTRPPSALLGAAENLHRWVKLIFNIKLTISR